ncbi:MAG: response regulator [Azospirillaceae bacterium]|nr:response regulator [Azospirillaceae bacterium]
MSDTILIVEDEPDLAALIADYVRAAGHEALVMGDGKAALAHIRQRRPRLIVLDLTLPGLDGIALCRAVREKSDVPIIMVTARVEEIDRVLGLETGADDYLCKPFSPRELIARIKTVLRRSAGQRADAPPVEIDEEMQVVRIRSHVLDLTPTEYRLFAAMAKRPGVILSRARLLDVAGTDNLDVTDRAIDSHVKNLRRKLSALLPGADIIQSVYGVGYRVEL